MEKQRDFCNKMHATKVNKTLKWKTVFKEEDANTQDFNTVLQFLTNPSDEAQCH